MNYNSSSSSSVNSNSAAFPNNSNVTTNRPETTDTINPSYSNNTNSVLSNEEHSISINMEGNNINANVPASRSMQRNILSFFNEARSQLGRQRSYPSTSIELDASMNQGAAHFSGANAVSRLEGMQNPTVRNINSDGRHSPSTSQPRNLRTWRMNLNDVLSFSAQPSTEAIRSLISHSGSFRYTPLNTSENAANADDNIHLLLNQRRAADALESQEGTTVPPGYRLSSRMNSNMQRTVEDSLQQQTVSGNPQDIPVLAITANSAAIIGNSSPNRRSDGSATGRNLQDIPAAAPPPPPPAAPSQQGVDDENNVISDILIKGLSIFVRYLPFLCILFVKFIHDHMLGILDLLLLHGVMYQANKSLRDQISKFSQKSYVILLRDLIMVAPVVAYRFILATSTPDLFGLLITPPSESLTIEVLSVRKDGVPLNSEESSLASSASEVLGNYLNQFTAKQQATATSTVPLENTVTITKTISLGVLLYYVAVNDLILKLITILLKICITMMPTRAIRHKPRARMFVLVEYLSQFYRAFAPVRQWLMFLFDSFTGFELLSGILFSFFYSSAKSFEFMERGKSLKKAIINFIRNIDYERKPTKDELDAAGTLCPICHDSYTAPVMLKCSHIFCDDCVGTWFKREQTCPMCRAKVCEDPTWQDGSTSFFYQLC